MPSYLTQQRCWARATTQRRHCLWYSFLIVLPILWLIQPAFRCQFHTYIPSHHLLDYIFAHHFQKPEFFLWEYTFVNVYIQFLYQRTLGPRSGRWRRQNTTLDVHRGGGCGGDGHTGEPSCCFRKCELLSFQLGLGASCCRSNEPLFAATKFGTVEGTEPMVDVVLAMTFVLLWVPIKSHST